MSWFQYIVLTGIAIAMLAAALTDQRGFLWALTMAVVIGTVINLARHWL